MRERAVSSPVYPDGGTRPSLLSPAVVPAVAPSRLERHLRRLADWMFEPSRSRIDLAAAVASAALISVPVGMALGELLLRGRR